MRPILLYILVVGSVAIIAAATAHANAHANTLAHANEPCIKVAETRGTAIASTYATRIRVRGSVHLIVLRCKKDEFKDRKTPKKRLFLTGTKVRD